MSFPTSILQVLNQMNTVEANKFSFVAGYKAVYVTDALLREIWLVGQHGSTTYGTNICILVLV